MQNDNQDMPEAGQSPADNPMPESSGDRAKKHIKKLNIFAGKGKYEAVVLIVVMALIAAGAYFLGHHTNKVNLERPAKSTKTAATEQTGSVAANLPPAEFLSGNTYLNSAKALPDLKFFDDTSFIGGVDANTGVPAVSQTDIHYYQVGTTKDGKQIIVFRANLGLGGIEGYALSDNGKYSLLLQMDTNLSAFPDIASSLNSNVTLDKTTKLNDITFPLNVTINNQKLKAETYTDKSSDLGLSDNEAIFMDSGLPSIRGSYLGANADSAPVKIADKDNLSYYKVVTQDEDNFKVQEIYGVFKSLFSVSYRPAGEIASTNGNIAINWSGGENNDSTYFSGGQGCGSRGYVIASNINQGQLKQVGKTPKGQPVYQLPTSSPLVQEIYNKDYNPTEDLLDGSLKNLSVQQLTDIHGYFLAQNGFGEYVLFQRDDMFIRGGCAKPVVYLYPQQKQQVSVKVGAQVVNSDPAYNGGWNNVTAYPDGSLSYGGKVYGSLFWDGYGYGSYPDIDSGTIVKTSDAVSTVKDQLAKQGLSGQETSDFLNYWMPKLEAISQPYTRLTWFNTAQMNRLAPLDISPAPQTLIRVFLDFQGLNKPYALKSQHLTSLSRQGFTVVEWGGLARDGLDR
jgi:hypothetical protein